MVPSRAKSAVILGAPLALLGFSLAHGLDWLVMHGMNDDNYDAFIALAVLLVCVQLLAGRRHFWLPAWLLRQSIARPRFRRALAWLRKPARFGDRLVRPRLTALAGDAAVKAIAVGCIVVALAMPVMEVVPFSANLAGIALTAFGLAVIAHDGLLALVALAATAAGVVVIASQLL